MDKYVEDLLVGIDEQARTLEREAGKLNAIVGELKYHLDPRDLVEKAKDRWGAHQVDRSEHGA